MAGEFEAIVKELALPMEQAWVVACDTAYTQSMAHASALAEALGWDRANEMLAKVWEQMGVNAAKTLLEQLKIEQRDASAPGKIIAFTVNNMFPEMKIEVVELSPNRAVDIGRGRCPWVKAAKALGIEGKIDLARLCTAQVTGISNAANPKISFEQKAGLCRGYEICHGVWEVRE